ncbi:STAS domain-containing protein [Streptomyces sp. NRRL S-1022]|uniref:STAS domain-containing protein n=1 Tax=Streptomyces sp. NRRL S-1022 TaxID=1463880 RepID=UPI00068FA301|nr:STAS domain-containing protein [Streptomyces sp. NRRL S-1022]
MSASSPFPAGPARACPGPTVLPLHGDIDLLTALALSARLDALTAHSCPDLVLDLRPAGFIDCAGLGVLCRARNRVLARRGRLRLVTDSARFLRMLRATGLWGVFEVQPRLPEAPAAYGPC